MPRLIGSFLLVLVFCAHIACSQASIRELPPNVNHPSINLFAPFISGDGQSMIYLSDYTDDGHHTMYFATRKSVSSWTDGEEMPKIINRPTHNFRGGYSLNFDGSMILYTSRKSGLGGYEIWYSEKQGKEWGAPKNMGGPVNSASNEGSPMVSPDGKYLYFMRCESMSEYKGAKGCKIMVSKRRGNRWGEPTELPENINTGNSQTPRILADGETLLFSSDQMGGKGRLDLYMSRKIEGNWTDPKPLDFINDERDNCFVSVPSKGRYMFADIKGRRTRNLAQVLIPQEYKPKGVMRIQGKVVDENNIPISAKLAIFNIDTRKRMWNEDIGSKGEFTIVLNEGANYDLSISNGQESMYYSKIYELESIGPRDKEKLMITLKPIIQGERYAAPIKFEPHSSELSDNSTFELRRIADLMRKSENMKIDLKVHLRDYRQDTVASDADLTEVLIDSIWVEKQVLLEENTNSDIQYQDSLSSDTLSLDSLQQEDVSVDSIQYEVIKELTLKYTYHNDRTAGQAESIKAYLVTRGISPERITTRGVKDDQMAVLEEEEDVTTQPEISFTITEL